MMNHEIVEEKHAMPATKSIHDAVTAEDRPMGEVEPAAPGVIVSYVYPALVIAALLVCLAFAA